MISPILRFWTGPIPFQSTRKNPFLDLLIHPIKRHLAKFYLKFLTLNGTIVIGITGSYGKTTTKEALKSILPSSVASAANIDPIYNIPATILSTPPWTKYLILEMGIEHLGEMDFYLWLAPVDIAVITGFGLAHTEFLKDLKTIKSEKLKITKYAKHVVNFSSHKPGPKNALSIARQVAKILEIKPDLSSFTPPPHRLQIINHPSGAIIIDDSYNANPTATKFAVDYLVDLAKKKNQTPVFVFAQMNELGSYEKSAHAAIDKYVAQKGIKNFLTLGPATANLGQHFKSRETLIPAIRKFLTPNYCLLIKLQRRHQFFHL
ncbi:MAG: UDP-N-acetylmuramoyl-tripeptide-D-alanyl-D-alanine ligase [Candidatus Amesbacteria bacterium GW2011_GWB1_47_26]|nr:MAG: UDP-N-acetylmuramoyl-tripeptide-D-alanyl-D-alanine ligase [Candidatus Amesbacteria bacterium GW2011_GWB1_47_26]